MSRGAAVTVAGAGALGLTCALVLADAGCRVTVRDPALGGVNASSVAAGMLAPVFEAVLDGQAQAFDLLVAARDFWPALAARAGVRLERSGALAVGSEAWLSRISEGMAALGAPFEAVGPARLPSLVSGLAAGFGRGILTADDWRLDSAAALAGLRSAASAVGVDVRREAVGGRDGADFLILATGAGRGLAAEQAHLSPIKGQILRFPGRTGEGPSLRGEGAYAVPGPQGLVVGATMEKGLDDARPDPSAVAGVLSVAQGLLPDLAGADYNLSAGVRATTPDGLPMVGPSAADPRTILAAGARRNGWLLAPLVARMVADMVTGRDPGPFTARLDPRRFDA